MIACHKSYIPSERTENIYRVKRIGMIAYNNKVFVLRLISFCFGVYYKQNNPEAKNDCNICEKFMAQG